MKRNFESFCNKKFDILIVGGGVYGIACAREAAYRGYSVGLVEKSDFGGATSANSAKIAHCGMRYLQHLDLTRMRQSIRERVTMHQLAPHLVESLRFLMPAYGHGVKGIEALSVYIKAYDWLSPERKQFKDPYRKVPDSKRLSPDEVVSLFPDADTEGLTGGIAWYEGQMQNTERLSLAMLQSAVDAGAECLNYAQVKSINTRDNTVKSLTVQDTETGKISDIDTQYVINATGPWAMELLKLVDCPVNDIGVHNSKALSLLTRSVTDDTAITFSIQSMYIDKKAVVNKKSSMQFAIPWRDKTMFASLHLPCSDVPEEVSITKEEISEYLSKINDGYPNLNLSIDDVEHVLWGVIPAESKGSAAPLKHYQLFDHSKSDGISGLATVIGVKFTTARDVAEKLFNKLGLNGSGSNKTSETPVKGGDIGYFDSFVKSSLSEYPHLPEDVVLRLIKTYGTEFEKVLSLAKKESKEDYIAGTNVLAAQVIYAVRFEMAIHLDDVLRRRLDIGSHEFPAQKTIEHVLELMADELGWSSSDLVRERKLFNNAYLDYIKRTSVPVEEVEHAE